MGRLARVHSARLVEQACDHALVTRFTATSWCAGLLSGCLQTLSISSTKHLNSSYRSRKSTRRSVPSRNMANSSVLVLGARPKRTISASCLEMMFALQGWTRIVCSSPSAPTMRVLPRPL